MHRGAQCKTIRLLKVMSFLFEFQLPDDGRDFARDEKQHALAGTGNGFGDLQAGERLARAVGTNYARAKMVIAYAALRS